MRIGTSTAPTSSVHVVPVISPFPLSAYHPEAHGTPTPSAPLGRIAVTPVRTGPVPVLNGPSPSTSVTYPTVRPGTSVTAFTGPGVPGSGMPRPRSRGRPSGAKRWGSGFVDTLPILALPSPATSPPGSLPPGRHGGWSTRVSHVLLP